MQGFENPTYVIAYIISNVVAILLLWASLKNARLSRLLFFLLFAWASWINMRTALTQPEVYLEYADLTFSSWYRAFILGPFKAHTALMVGSIAVCQGLIALTMLMKGLVFRIGAVGAMVFLISIAPLGVGSAFPCTLVMAVGLLFLLRRKNIPYLWKKSTESEMNLA